MPQIIWPEIMDCCEYGNWTWLKTIIFKVCKGWESNRGSFCFTIVFSHSSAKSQRLYHCFKTGLERFGGSKRPSLFCLSVSDGDKECYNVDTWDNVIKLFMAVIYELL